MRRRHHTLRRRYGHAKGADQLRRAERRKLLPYQDKVYDEQRFAKGVRIELKAMFFSGNPVVHYIEKSGDDAADFYRKHIDEFDQLYRQGYTATDAARTIGNKHRVRHFR